MRRSGVLLMRRRTGSAITAAVGLVAVAVVAFVNLAQDTGVVEQPVLAPVADPAAPIQVIPVDGADYASAAAIATALPVIDHAVTIPDYRRDAFGDAWSDIDGNGCRQRDDVLARDLVDVVVDDRGCTVLTGTLHDPYTGNDLLFQHDRVVEPENPGSQGVQIDHIVSLAAAYRGGAWAWTPEQRQTFANSFDVLLAVDGPANQSKQDRGPASWLPATGYVCTYALQYTEILHHWDLAVDVDDQAALVRTLTDCGAGV